MAALPADLAVLSLALLLWLAGMRGRFLWTAAGGVVVALGAAALAVVDLRRSQPFLAPANLPAALWLLGFGAVVWSTIRRLRRSHRGAQAGAIGGDAAPWSGPGRGERWALLAGGLALIALAVVLPSPPPEFGQPAAAVPWYWSGLAALATYLGPRVAWGVVPLATLVALLALPYLELDDGEDGEFAAQTQRLELGVLLLAALTLWVVPIVLAALPPPVRAIEPQPLSHLFWRHALGVGLPAGWWLRELPGLVLLAGFFVFLPLILPLWSPTRGLFGRYRDALGWPRYLALMAAVLAVLAVPLVIYVNRIFGVGRLLVLPELGQGT
ncbi:MAG: hypothetical protein D6696_14200 [Acidobacteria bacterium]|nr:MAG: hypothetical protein D6696_14200 [Acidobacteriota bacterium]